MTFTLQKHELLRSLDAVAKIAGSSQNMLILSAVLIVCTGTEMQCFATNLDLSIRVKIPLESQTARTCVDAARLYDVVKSLRAGDVAMTIDSTGLAIKQGRSRFSLGLLDPDDFPEWPTFDSTVQFTFQADKFVGMAGRVDYAMGREQGRHFLMGLHIDITDETMAMVCTDGRRMARIEADLPTKITPIKCIIPDRSIKFLKGALVGEMVVGFNARMVSFEFGNTVILSRLLDATYPNYMQFLTNTGERLVSIDRLALLDALRQADSVGRGEPVSIEFLPESVCVTTEAQVGNATIEVPAVNNSGRNGLVVHAPPAHMIDLVSHVVKENLTLELPETYGPVFAEDDDFVSLVMPIKK